MMISEIIKLTKPGIIFGNILPCIGAFFMASNLHFTNQFIYAILGAIFVIASGCTFNQIIDVKIDSKMERTKKRPLVVGSVSKQSAFFFGVLFGVIGFSLLYFKVNLYSFYASVVGFVFYVFLYSFSKTKTVLSVYLGSVSGSTTPLIGFFAYNPSFELSIILFFIIMFIWQIPHTFAIHIFNNKDYANAKVPTIFNKNGFDKTKNSIRFHITLFTIVNIFFAYNVQSLLYFVIAILLCAYWIYMSFKKNLPKEVWAKKIFFISIIIITSLSILIAFV